MDNIHDLQNDSRRLSVNVDMDTPERGVNYNSCTSMKSSTSSRMERMSDARVIVNSEAIIVEGAVPRKT